MSEPAPIGKFGTSFAMPGQTLRESDNPLVAWITQAKDWNE